MSGRFDPEVTLAEEVHVYRETTGAGMMEAKRFIRKEKIVESLMYLRANGTIADKVEWLLDRYAETLE